MTRLDFRIYVGQTLKLGGGVIHSPLARSFNFEAFSRSLVEAIQSMLDCRTAKSGAMLAILGILGFSTAFGQDVPSIKFATGYSNGINEAHPHAGVELASGGYFMVGDSLITGNDAVSRQQFVVKSDVDGTEIWQTAFGDLGYNYGKFGLELSDKTLLVFGSASIASSSSSSSSSYTGLPVGRMLRFSSSGSVIWDVTFKVRSSE